MEIRTNAPVAVVGAGTMGVGIAQVAAIAGHCVTVLDMNAEALDRGRTGLGASLDAAVARGRLDQAARNEIWDRIHWSQDLALAANAALVVEAIVEELEIKRRLFGGLARVVRFNTVLASNTSSLEIGAIAEQLSLRGRFLGLHFFNPVPAMKLVEVIAGPDTDPAVVEAVTSLMRAWGKMPVRVRDVAGFIVNRVARPYYAEGFAALGEGVDPATVDAAMVEAGGFRMGPLSLADMIGHDVNYAVAASVFDAGVGLPRFRLQEAQRSLVERKLLGRKSSKGVYDYTAPLPAPFYIDGTSARIEARVSDGGLLRPVVEAARAAGVAVLHDDRLPPETIELDGIRMALGDGRTLAERTGVHILVDHARDFTIAKTIAITARSASHAAVAAGFFRAAERRTLMVADRPGQLVLRTLAQLANAAADTIADQIASAEDVETAMLYGANHPEGPLSWARRLGCDRVRLTLGHIARATGDPIYSPSALFEGRVS